MMTRIAFWLWAVSAIVLVSAVPYDKRWPPEGGWPITPSRSIRMSDDCEGSDGYQSSDNHQDVKRSYLRYEQKAVSTGTCDLQKAIDYMDLQAVDPPLPSPVGLTLFQVALGRGIQNYTCDLANATATPVPLGAVATLYNFSCVAAQKPALLKHLPHIAINQPLPTSNNTDTGVLDRMTSGHHYFVDSTTPFFNLDTDRHHYGMGALAKSNASDAPIGATPGVHGQLSYGAVPWLRLDQKPYKEDLWKAVYRLNTAGGNAPKSCTGQAAAFEVPYAAEYWLFQ